MKPVDFSLSIASNAASALEAREASGAGAKFLAGGQSLGPMLNLRLARPTALVDLSRAAELRAACEDGEAIVYGAAVTHAEIEDGEVPDATPGWLARIASGIAYRAVRNRGTIGGSLAHADPAADWIVTLTALAAEVLIAGPSATRRVAMPGFMTAPFETRLGADEIITGVRVPKRGAASRFGYWKFVRKPGEFAKASAAVMIDGDEARIAIGALEAPPVLLADPQPVISDPTLAARTIARACPGRDPASLALHAVAVIRAIEQIR